VPDGPWFESRITRPCCKIGNPLARISDRTIVQALKPGTFGSLGTLPPLATGHGGPALRIIAFGLDGDNDCRTECLGWVTGGTMVVGCACAPGGCRCGKLVQLRRILGVRGRTPLRDRRCSRAYCWHSCSQGSRHGKPPHRTRPRSGRDVDSQARAGCASGGAGCVRLLAPSRAAASSVTEPSMIA
jgi:hypothetical protein